MLRLRLLASFGFEIISRPHSAMRLFLFDPWFNLGSRFAAGSVARLCGASQTKSQSYRYYSAITVDAPALNHPNHASLRGNRCFGRVFVAYESCVVLIFC